MKKYFILFLIFFVSLSISSLLNAQIKNFNPQFLRISEDNDFINLRGEGTDRFFTNGTRIDLFYTKKKQRKLITKLLMPLGNDADDLYNIGITQLMFTPSDITQINIIKNERPYAGLLLFNHGLISSNERTKEKLTTEINIGVIGPASFAKETQTWIHKAISYQIPLGWDNQVKNDFIFNYLLRYEKQLLSPTEKFELIGMIGADAGTLYNQIISGLTFRVGNFNSYFSNYEKSFNYKKFQFFFYVKPSVIAFMDNSTLQGGTFTGYQSVHTINADDLTRFYMQFEYGFILGTRRFGISINEKLRTPEYKLSPTIQVGNITFFIGL